MAAGWQVKMAGKSTVPYKGPTCWLTLWLALLDFGSLWWLVFRWFGLLCFSLMVGLPIIERFCFSLMVGLSVIERFLLLLLLFFSLMVDLPVIWSVLFVCSGWFTGPLVCFVSLWWLVYRSLNGFILLWWLVYRSLNGVVSLWWLVYWSLNGFIPLWWLVNQSEFELTLDELWPPRQALEVSRSFHYCFLVTLGCVFLNSANHNVHTCIRCQFLKSFSALNGTGEHEREFIKCVFHLNSSELRRWVFLLK